MLLLSKKHFLFLYNTTIQIALNHTVRLLFLSLLILFCCSTDSNTTTNDVIIDPIDDIEEGDDDNDDPPSSTLRILSLGDSYTIGTGVCEQCSYPKQLKDSLTSRLNLSGGIELKVIASAGWTTTSLLAALNAEDSENNYDLVTLLIGVNNQFQHLSFSLFEVEFDQLISQAKIEGGNDNSNIIVISIPDYTYTPFGQSAGNPETNSEEIDLYNTYIESYCAANNITYLYVTDISREGLDHPELVADDNLHLSTLAYSYITERLLPVALEKLN